MMVPQPILRAQNGAIISEGGSVVIEGELVGAIAYVSFASMHRIVC